MAYRYSFNNTSITFLGAPQIAWIKMHINAYANDTDNLYCGGFEWEFAPCFSNMERCLRIFADNGGSVTAAVAFMQEYMRAWNWGTALQFRWAAISTESCSGGAAVVTAKSVRYLNVDQWLNEETKKAYQREQRERRNKEGSNP